MTNFRREERTCPLEGRYIGIDETEDEIWSDYFRDVLLGRYHEEERTSSGKNRAPASPCLEAKDIKGTEKEKHRVSPMLPV